MLLRLCYAICAVLSSRMVLPDPLDDGTDPPLSNRRSILVQTPAVAAYAHLYCTFRSSTGYTVAACAVSVPHLGSSSIHYRSTAHMS
eukprot:873398-Rhodomonas_salina.1